VSIWPHSREGVGLFFGAAEVLSARRLRGCRFLNCGAGEARARVAVALRGCDAELSPAYARANKSVASRLARVNREASVLWQALRWVPEASALDRDAGAAESTDGPDFQLFFGAAGEQEGAVVDVVSAVESTFGR
jgi:hypothetical protein